MKRSAKPDKNQLSKELRQQALAWAEFLYDEYVLKKHKQLLLTNQHTTIQTKAADLKRNEGKS